MANERLVKVHALRKRGTHVVLAEFFERRILHQKSQEREFADHVAENRQNQMVSEVYNLFEEGKVFEIIAREAAQRENVEVRTAREEYNQQDTESVARHHVARENHARRKRITFASVMHRLPEAQRNTDKVTQEERGDSKEQRNRETARNHVPHGEPICVTGAQVQVQNVPEPSQVTLPGGLVKTEVRLDLRNLVG